METNVAPQKGRYPFQLPKKFVEAHGMDRGMVLELRGDGHLTMFPPSTHPSGELVTWAGDPTAISMETSEDLLRLCGLCAAMAVILRFYPRTAGDRDSVCLALAGTLIRTALNDGEIDNLVASIARLAGDDEAEHRAGKAAASRLKLTAGEPVWGLPELCKRLEIEDIEPTLKTWLGLCGGASPLGAYGTATNSSVIIVSPGNRPDEVDMAEAALIGAGIGVYQRGEHLVRVCRLPKSVGEDGVARPGGAVVLTPVKSPWLLEQLARVAQWVRRDRNDELAPINPPFGHAAAYIARSGEWRVPVFNGIISAPTLRADGSIFQSPVFDLESGLLYEPGGVKFPLVPERPTRDEALQSLAALKHPFRDFMFAESADASVLWAATLTALIRRALPTAPLFAFDAPTAGSGKSLLAETIGVIAMGHPPTLISQGKSVEEDEKRLGAVLMAGDAILVIDNCDQPLRGDSLCTVLTTEIWGSRILGKSELARTPTNALFIATGNNLEVTGDLGRRTLMCRLDTGEERPDLIQHDFDPRVEALAARPEIVVAGLTVLRAYVVAGRPSPSKPLGSFPDWNLVRGALMWLGEPDPAATRERAMADDPRKSELSELLGLWVAALVEGAYTLAAIGANCEGGSSRDLSDLYQALVALGRNGQFNTRSIGRRLAKHKDRVVAGRVLRCEDGSDGVKRYRVEIRSSAIAPETPQNEIPF